MQLIATALVVLAALTATASAATRIVAFGDSATYGYLVPRGQDYPAQLQAALRANGQDVIVSNQGVNGDTTGGALSRLDAAIGPDTNIAMVEFGVNDLRRHVPRQRMRANVAEIVRTLRARGIEVLVVGLGRLDLSAVAKASGALYAQWNLPPGKYRARDGAHLNAEGYAIVVRQMLPQVETLIARVLHARVLHK
jgi:acyl-CoA thioesterase-1